MRVRWGWLPLVLLALLAAQTVTAAQPGFGTRTLAGYFPCRVVAPDSSTPCSTPGGALERAHIELAASDNISAIVLEARWTSPPGSDLNFRVAADRALDARGTKTFTIIPQRPVRLLEVPSDLDAHRWSLAVEPLSGDGAPAAVRDQRFDVAVSVFVEGATPTPDYSFFAETGSWIPPPIEPSADLPALFVADPAPTTPNGAWLALLGPLAFAALLGPRLRGALVAWLLTRISRDRLAEQARRRQILEAVRAEPGVTVAEARRRLEIPRSSFAYHASVLGQAGLIHVVRRRGRQHLWPMGGTPLAVAPTTALEVYDSLERGPGRSARRVADELGLSIRLTRYHLERLARLGRVRRGGPGRNAPWFPAAAPSL